MFSIPAAPTSASAHSPSLTTNFNYPHVLFRVVTLILLKYQVDIFNFRLPGARKYTKLQNHQLSKHPGNINIGYPGPNYLLDGPVANEPVASVSEELLTVPGSCECERDFARISMKKFSGDFVRNTSLRT